MKSNTELYESDFYEWTRITAALLRQGSYAELDPETVAEEIESLGKSYRRELVSRLTLILTHRLKWDYQPEKRSPSWIQTVKIQRLELLKLIKDNPSLRRILEDPQTLAEAYESARLYAASETGKLEYDFPPSCSYTLEQTMTGQFWLDNAS